MYLVKLCNVLKLKIEVLEISVTDIHLLFGSDKPLYATSTKTYLLILFFINQRASKLAKIKMFHEDFLSSASAYTCGKHGCLLTTME